MTTTSRSAKRGWSIGVLTVLVVGLAGAVACAQQWRESVALRARIETLRRDTAELEWLRVEHERLRALQPAPAELAALRADHAALPRLRVELEALKGRSKAR